MNSTALIPLLQRESQTISFSPILEKVAAGIMGFSKRGLDIVRKDDYNLLDKSAQLIHKNLAPGPRLHALEERVVQSFAVSLNVLAITSGPLTLNLHDWISREIIAATPRTIYGSRNPFQDHENVIAWKQVTKGFVPLLMNFLPQITARKHVQAREKLVKAFELYYEEGGHHNSDTSALITERFSLFTQLGLPTSDIARHEVGASVALLANTIQAIFWFVYHVFSDPDVLDSCRMDLSGAVKDDNGVRTLSMSHLQSSCQVFLSTFKETMRFHGVNVAARLVRKDVVIDEKYLLKESGIVLIPATVQHQQISVWGPDADSFNYRRFIPKSSSKQETHDPAAFRAFGGRPVICPGRFFASTEILALTALMILRFDVQPREGYWSAPTVEKSNPGISFQQPDHDIEMDVRPRDTCQWAVVHCMPDEGAEMREKGLFVTN